VFSVHSPTLTGLRPLENFPFSAYCQQVVHCTYCMRVSVTVCPYASFTLNANSLLCHYHPALSRTPPDAREGDRGPVAASHHSSLRTLPSGPMGFALPEIRLICTEVDWICPVHLGRPSADIVLSIRHSKLLVAFKFTARPGHKKKQKRNSWF
jgi:hypothetical protein